MTRGSRIVAAALLGIVALLAPTAIAPAQATPSRAAAAGVSATASDPSRPLMILLDTSGSMADPDGHGTVKLAGAKSGIESLIKQQSLATEMGLWSYPASGGCGPGRLQVPVKAFTDRAPLVNTLNGLRADGNTPTAAALNAVVDSLKQQGKDGATVVLISDGLSNCGGDPCKAAEDVIAAGFDLTVQAIGFQISREGLQQLRCIAHATGGDVYDAEDAAILGRTLNRLGAPQLTMTVDVPSSVPAGSGQQLWINVANNSAVDILNAKVALTFTDRVGPQNPIVPAVVPPKQLLGNLPAGSSVTRSWTIGFGVPSQTGSAGYVFAAWGDRAQPSFVTGDIAVTGDHLSLSDGGSWLQDLDGKRIAIVGDSYSAGEGAGQYLPEEDQQLRTCHRSHRTYLADVLPQDSVDLIACSGAKTSVQQDDKASSVRGDQTPVLQAHSEGAQPDYAVFLTVGGNDVGFADIVTKCVGPSGLKYWVAPDGRVYPYPDMRCSDDPDWVDQQVRNIQGTWNPDRGQWVGGLRPSLVSTYKDVWNSANTDRAVANRGGALAPVFVLGYPQLFPDAQYPSCPGFDADEVGFGNRLVDVLDATIQDAVGSAWKDGYQVFYVDGIQSVFLPSHTSCAKDHPYVNPVSLVRAALIGIFDWVIKVVTTGSVNKYLSRLVGHQIDDPHNAQQLLHPNIDGYAAESDAIITWSKDADLSPPPGGWQQPYVPLRVSPLQQVMDTLRPQTTAGSIDISDAPSANEVAHTRAGGYLDVNGSDLMPGTGVQVSIESRLQMLTTLDVDSDGTLDGKVEIPRSLAPGTHVIHVTAVAADGTPVLYSREVDVSLPYPWWLLPLLVASGLGLLAAAVGATVLRRDARRRRRQPAETAAIVADPEPPESAS